MSSGTHALCPNSFERLPTPSWAHQGGGCVGRARRRRRRVLAHQLLQVLLVQRHAVGPPCLLPATPPCSGPLSGDEDMWSAASIHRGHRKLRSTLLAHVRLPPQTYRCIKDSATPLHTAGVQMRVSARACLRENPADVHLGGDADDRSAHTVLLGGLHCVQHVAGIAGGQRCEDDQHLHIAAG